MGISQSSRWIHGTIFNKKFQHKKFVTFAENKYEFKDGLNDPGQGNVLAFFELNQSYIFLNERSTCYSFVTIPDNSMVYLGQNKYWSSLLTCRNIKPIHQFPKLTSLKYLIKAVKEDPSNVRLVPPNLQFGQLEHFLEALVWNNPNALQYLSFQLQTNYVCQAAIDKDPFSIRYVKRRNFLLFSRAIKKNPASLLHIQSPTYNMCAFGTRLDPSLIDRIDVTQIVLTPEHPTIDLFLSALKID
ncbi:MAG: hypothetical protein Hyperionvirus31_18 [Hyperionvirus sp.]|uniref:Uncharacterized protein n=1 Tax=Hyperionvirus sp. TaxID=2487770 RepID=A0A3G5ABL3_9VIRU|nr:MAG: hypothetical protein Hyperionvirus31_18 [Hyperionvirus sp.]